MRRAVHAIIAIGRAGSPAPGGLWLDRLRTAIRLVRYRPERHYMRGPGPACRAKQALAAAPVAALNPRLSPQAIRPARRPWRDIELAPKFLWA